MYFGIAILGTDGLLAIGWGNMYRSTGFEDFWHRIRIWEDDTESIDINPILNTALMISLSGWRPTIYLSVCDRHPEFSRDRLDVVSSRSNEISIHRMRSQH